MTHYTVTGTKEDLMKSEGLLSSIIKYHERYLNKSERKELTDILHAIGKAIDEANKPK